MRLPLGTFHLTGNAALAGPRFCCCSNVPCWLCCKDAAFSNVCMYYLASDSTCVPSVRSISCCHDVRPPRPWSASLSPRLHRPGQGVRGAGIRPCRHFHNEAPKADLTDDSFLSTALVAMTRRVQGMRSCLTRKDPFWRRCRNDVPTQNDHERNATI